MLRTKILQKNFESKMFDNITRKQKLIVSFEILSVITLIFILLCQIYR